MVFINVNKKSNKNNEINSQTTISSENKITSNVENTTLSTNSNLIKKYISAEKFINNKIWLTYTEDVGTYLVCVDSKGKALFQFSGADVTSHSDFSNGFAYVTYKGVFSVIDETGTILCSFPTDSFGEVKAYGDGYTLTEKYVSDFDSSYYLYTIYDSSSKVVTDFTLTDNGQIRKANYCGEGVFGIQMRGSWNDPTEFYCIRSDKFVKVQGDIECSFDNGIAVVGIEYADPDESGYRAKMLVLTPSGECSNVAIYPENGWNWSDEVSINESACILVWPFEDDGVFVNYDFSAKKFFSASDYYIEKINWEKAPEVFTYDSGVVAVPLKGSDGKDYVVVFDKEMENVIEPIECTSFSGYNSGRMKITNTIGTDVYDENGKKVFSLLDIGCTELSDYSEGIAVADLEKCIDVNGNTIFEFNNIDYSTVNNVQ